MSEAGIHFKIDPVKSETKNVECSNCKLPLFRVIAKPTEEKNYRINARCPACGDKCFEVKIKGRLVFASSDYCHAKPRPVYKERASIDEPLEYTDQIDIECEQYKPWRKK